VTLLQVASIPALLERHGVVVSTPHRRDDATVWDLELDGERRRSLRLSLIHDARPGGVIVVWAHLAPPLGDGLRKAYRRLLEWNDKYLFAKFGIAEDGLLDETAAWIWIGGRIPADDGSPRRNQPLLRAVPDLADRLEG
jgi:hypothetical protein